MNFTWDFNTATILALLTNLVMVVVFAVNTNTKAAAALDKAAAAQKTADDARTAVSMLSAAVAMFREHVAEKYVDKSSLVEMEARLTRLIENVGERVDALLHRSTK